MCVGDAFVRTGQSPELVGDCRYVAKANDVKDYPPAQWESFLLLRRTTKKLPMPSIGDESLRAA